MVRSGFLFSAPHRESDAAKQMAGLLAVCLSRLGLPSHDGRLRSSSSDAIEDALLQGCVGRAAVAPSLPLSSDNGAAGRHATGTAGTWNQRPVSDGPSWEARADG